MKRVTIILCIVVGFLNNLFCQSNTVHIKGRVVGSRSNSIEIMSSGRYEPTTYYIPVEKDGNFKTSISIEMTEEIILFLDSGAIPINTRRGDSLDLYWNDNDIENTFQISSNNKLRNIELNIEYSINKKFGKSFNTLIDKLNSGNISVSEKKTLLHKIYIDELTFAIQKMEEDSLNKHLWLFTNIYFKFADVFLRYHLLDGGNDELYPGDSLKAYPSLIFRNKFYYKTIYDSAFYHSPAYREFIFNYIYADQLFDKWIYSGQPAEHSDLYNNYYKAEANLNIPVVRDWFIAKLMMRLWERDDRDEREIIYQEFIKTCKTRQNSQDILEFKKNVVNLASGKPAPSFTLKDISNRSISLSELKGKVIYIDFWGVACRPCIEEIKNSVPTLHKKYQGKNIVFLNICVDSNVEKWKGSIRELNLTGINLIAEGWTSNEVCKSYRVAGIPRYILIDAKGNLVAIEAPHPAQLVNTEENIIDKLLN